MSRNPQEEAVEETVDKQASVEDVTYEASAEKPDAGDASAGQEEPAGGDMSDEDGVSAGHEAKNAELEALGEQIRELENKLLRQQAEFDNFRRRTRMEKEDFAKYASQKLIEQLLPVVDNFERALSAGKDGQHPDSLIKGLEMIYRQMVQVLEQEGVQPIEAVGRPFNPEYHQAVMQVESAEHEEGTVVEELQKGYMFKEKVIRPSMVKVSS